MRTVNHFNIKSITKKNMPFFIGWVIVFIWLYSYYLPFGNFKFQSDLYNSKIGNPLFFTAVWLTAVPFIVIFFSEHKYMRFTFYSVITAIFCFVLLRFTPAGLVSESILFVGSACMGHIFASSCYSFFMILNNAEKFYSMLLAVFIPKLFLLIKPVLNKPHVQVDISNIIIFILLFVLLVCTFLYRNNVDKISDKTNITPPKNAYALMALIFVVLALNDVIAPTVISVTLTKFNISFELFYFLGITFGIIFVLLFQRLLRLELYSILNLSFALAALGFISGALSIINSVYGVLSFVFFGLSYSLGIVNIYYLAGFMAKKFQSGTFYKTVILLYSAYYFLSILTAQQLNNHPINYINDTVVLFAFISVIILIIFLALTPYFIMTVSSKEWMDDTYRIDITHETRLTAKLYDYKLSPREIETCQKLLVGYTLKQIAAIMGISFSTVNTYCTSIYKKLSINSRAELMVLLKEYSIK
ncbi:MAG: helix-turn-helix transcriptional regulator [Eubacteriaceae bacterium]|nr:helix-turn-helix transcriptional regulator [Eubacteriaceae bacterium]